MQSGQPNVHRVIYPLGKLPFTTLFGPPLSKVEIQWPSAFSGASTTYIAIHHPRHQGSLSCLIMQLTCACQISSAWSWVFRFHVTLECCCMYPSLWFCGSENIHIMMGPSGQSWFVCHNQTFIRSLPGPSNNSGAVFQRGNSLSGEENMILFWNPRSLGGASFTGSYQRLHQASLSAIDTFKATGSARLEDVSGRAFCTTALTC